MKAEHDMLVDPSPSLGQVVVKAERSVSKISKVEDDVSGLAREAREQGGKVARVQVDLEQARADFEARIARLEKVVVVLQVRRGGGGG